METISLVDVSAMKRRVEIHPGIFFVGILSQKEMRKFASTMNLSWSFIKPNSLNALFMSRKDLQWRVFDVTNCDGRYIADVIDQMGKAFVSECLLRRDVVHRDEVTTK